MSYNDYASYSLDPLSRPRFYGVYRASVLSNSDFENKKRLKVIVPQITGSDSMDLVPPCVSSGSLSNIRVPEIGESIWVIFESGDPEYPLWITDSWYSGGSSLGYCGSFLSTTIQASSTTAKAVTFNRTTLSNGITLSNSSRINFTKTGTYSISFQGQLYQSSSANNQPEIHIWLKKNGNANIDNSTWQYDTSTQMHYVVPSFNYMGTFSAGEYIEFYWHSSDPVNLWSSGANSTIGMPGIPSAVVNVTQI